MPDKRTAEKAREDKRAGKAPTTQAGEFVREEIDKIRHGAHGARSPEQAIAIGLSKARGAGVALRPPRKGNAKASTRKRRQASTSARPVAGRVSRALCHGFSRTNRGARHRTPLFRVMQSALPRVVRPPNVLPRQRKRCERRALPAAQQRHVKQLGPERATKHREMPAESRLKSSTAIGGSDESK
jgi:hypothetical protein